MTPNNQKYGHLWTREESILALYTYCQIPFARTKANNPEVIRLANLLGRTPSSVARKLGNFGAFDPLLAKQGITGLTHTSKMDREIWDEFHGRWESLIIESQHLLEQFGAEEALLEKTQRDELPIIARPRGTTERATTVLTRLCQSFFRRAILSSYESRCCVCGIDMPQLLIASHIMPWAANKDSRTDPENGLCLCALHDKAFDRGLISLTTSYEIIVTRSITKSKSDLTRITISSFHGRTITLPQRFQPKDAYIKWHYTNIFQA